MGWLRWWLGGRLYTATVDQLKKIKRTKCILEKNIKCDKLVLKKSTYEMKQKVAKID